ncbi:MAG: hypothetical protein LAO31_16805 [Acidobacteriia bacterium]|nr:hypothetical protein [Terriglobia bacterium]
MKRKTSAIGALGLLLILSFVLWSNFWWRIPATVEINGQKFSDGAVFKRHGVLLVEATNGMLYAIDPRSREILGAPNGTFLYETRLFIFSRRQNLALTSAAKLEISMRLLPEPGLKFYGIHGELVEVRR